MAIKPIKREEVTTDIMNQVPDEYVTLINDLIRENINSINNSFQLTYSYIFTECDRRGLKDFQKYESGLIMLFEKQGWKIEKCTFKLIFS